LSAEDAGFVDALRELSFVPVARGGLRRARELFHPRVGEAAELLDGAEVYPSGLFAAEADAMTLSRRLRRCALSKTCGSCRTAWGSWRACSTASRSCAPFGWAAPPRAKIVCEKLVQLAKIYSAATEIARAYLCFERSADLLNRAAKAQTGDPPFVHDFHGTVVSRVRSLGPGEALVLSRPSPLPGEKDDNARIHYVVYRNPVAPAGCDYSLAVCTMSTTQQRWIPRRERSQVRDDRTQVAQ